MSGLKDELVVKTIPTSSSGAGEWMEWHKKLKSKLGRKNANLIWLKAWVKRNGIKNANTSELRLYMKGQGVSIDTNALQDIQDFGISSAEGFANMGKYTLMAVALVIGVPLFIALFNVAKDSSSITKGVLKAKTGG